MTSQKCRSRRAFRKIYKKVPGGTVKVRFEHRKPKKARCTRCGNPLQGVPQLRPHEARTTAKTRKRPERPFGGVLCSPCLRLAMIEKARQGLGK